MRFDDFTCTRNRWRHFMQLRSNPDFVHGDFEMFSRVWRSIESLCLTSGLRKYFAREVSIRSVPQYQISPNFFSMAYLREVEIKKSTITLKYAMHAERICIKIDYLFLLRDFLCTRQENVILRTSEGNWDWKYVISKIYILCIKIENIFPWGDFLCLRASKFSVLKLYEIVILWVYYTIPFGFSLFGHSFVITIQRFEVHCLTKDHWWGFSTRNVHMVHIVN